VTGTASVSLYYCCTVC